MLSEWEIIDYLRRRARRGRGVRVGIGDDAAVLAGSGREDWVVTTDLMIEDVHFLREAQPARAVGHKAVARSLSDVAAMAAVARYALIALAVPPELPARWVKQFFSGALALARRHRVALAGGDLSRSGRIIADVQVLGTVEKGKAIRRAGAKAGDAIFVSGELGLARLGLAVLRARLAEEEAVVRRAVRAHFYPQPRLRLARTLRRFPVSAMIDVSDGLSSDLYQLCLASRVGARLETAQIPATRIASRVAEELGVTPLELALHGGEDYELLFTLPARAARRLPRRLGGVVLQRIGTIQRGRKIVLVDAEGRRKPLAARGWEHFAGRR
ncbi:MAG: thiamine-phosphate kinase [Terriglobia bacterium]